MNVKEAAKIAKEYVSDLFADEDIVNVGLEEIQRDQGGGFWIVTVGFSRPWDYGGLAAITYGRKGLRRSYKVLRIHAETGNVESVKDRILQEAN